MFVTLERLSTISEAVKQIPTAQSSAIHRLRNIELARNGKTMAGMIPRHG
ncbi:hypothetical protein [Sphingomonas solaris]|nr:hypothetical protein [Sphingomonas solaris]